MLISSGAAQEQPPATVAPGTVARLPSAKKCLSGYQMFMDEALASTQTACLCSGQFRDEEQAYTYCRQNQASVYIKKKCHRKCGRNPRYPEGPEFGLFSSAESRTPSMAMVILLVLVTGSRLISPTSAAWALGSVVASPSPASARPAHESSIPDVTIVNSWVNKESGEKTAKELDKTVNMGGVLDLISSVLRNMMVDIIPHLAPPTMHDDVKRHNYSISRHEQKIRDTNSYAHAQEVLIGGLQAQLNRMKMTLANHSGHIGNQDKRLLWHSRRVSNLTASIEDKLSGAGIPKDLVSYIMMMVAVCLLLILTVFVGRIGTLQSQFLFLCAGVFK